MGNFAWKPKPDHPAVSKDIFLQIIGICELGTGGWYSGYKTKKARSKFHNKHFKRGGSFPFEFNDN